MPQQSSHPLEHTEKGILRFASLAKITPRSHYLEFHHMSVITPIPCRVISQLIIAWTVGGRFEKLWEFDISTSVPNNQQAEFGMAPAAEECRMQRSCCS
jgi:hypothetical protein